MCLSLSLLPATHLCILGGLSLHVTDRSFTGQGKTYGVIYMFIQSFRSRFETFFSKEENTVTSVCVHEAALVTCVPFSRGWRCDVFADSRRGPTTAKAACRGIGHRVHSPTTIRVDSGEPAAIISRVGGLPVIIEMNSHRWECLLSTMGVGGSPTSPTQSHLTG